MLIPALFQEEAAQGWLRKNLPSWMFDAPVLLENWQWLGLLALVFHDDRAVLLALVAGLGVIALLAPPPFFADDVLRMSFVSVATAAMLAAIGVLAARGDASTPAGSPT